MLMTFQFKQAVRENVSLLIALAGPSGSGKTMSALRLALGLSPSGRIAFIDTEAGRALHYAPKKSEPAAPPRTFPFMHEDMRAPFRPERFVEAIRAAESASAEVVILDSFSHEYDGEGGIIDWADELAEGTPKPGIDRPRREGSDPDWWKDWLVKPVKAPGNWKEPKLAHKRMMNALLQCRASIIFCLRADEKIEIIKDGGRTQVRPLGWCPIAEKRFMYEMTASFTLTADNPGKPNYRLPHKVQEQHRQFFRDGETIGETAGQLLAAWARGVPTALAGKPLAEEGGEAAAQGSVALRAFWSRLTPDEKRAVGGAEKLAAWKAIAADADNPGHSETGAGFADPSPQAAGTEAGARDSAGAAPAADQDGEQEESLLSRAQAAAMGGRATYDAFWNELDPFDRDELKPHQAALMSAANKASGRG
jgi:hypothetical protein